ncbi:MAG: sugar ABC transporter ATP-binding protein, partial [Bacteroidaceae bacterium]|nr:sugar ABC transporter ATP-binding protein [Bacteroidaceae bacterium]
KAISRNTKLLILDEPTAALTIKETQSLLKVLASLKAQGVGMIYVSHRMEEIFDISDRVTVLRDGQLVGTRNTDETDDNELVKMMVGREIINHYPHWEYNSKNKNIKLKVENLNVKNKLKDISFELYDGEILGIAGLMGAGRTELAKSLFGVENIESGKIWIDGKPVSINSPKDAIDLGISLVVEDRKDEGLVLISSSQNNINLPNMDLISRFSIVNEKDSVELSNKVVEDLSVKTSSIKVNVNTLSGGNQQKIVIGKWLARNPEILILDEPTRGVDVGAKNEIYEIIIRLAKKGVAIIMISSDLPEVLNIPNRILVMHEGEITGEFSKEEATQEKIMLAATGVSVQ